MTTYVCSHCGRGVREKFYGNAGCKHNPYWLCTVCYVIVKKGTEVTGCGECK
jgi:hypothetical protein